MCRQSNVTFLSDSFLLSLKKKTANANRLISINFRGLVPHAHQTGLAHLHFSVLPVYCNEKFHKSQIFTNEKREQQQNEHFPQKFGNMIIFVTPKRANQMYSGILRAVPATYGRTINPGHTLLLVWKQPQLRQLFVHSYFLRKCTIKKTCKNRTKPQCRCSVRRPKFAYSYWNLRPIGPKYSFVLLSTNAFCSSLK